MLPNVLPLSLRPYAKCLYPFLLALGTAVASWIISGDFNGNEVRAAGGGAVLSLVTFLVPNGATFTQFKKDSEEDDGVTTLGTDLRTYNPDATPPPSHPAVAEDYENGFDTIEDREDV